VTRKQVIRPPTQTCNYASTLTQAQIHSANSSTKTCAYMHELIDELLLALFKYACMHVCLHDSSMFVCLHDSSMHVCLHDACMHVCLHDACMYVCFYACTNVYEFWHVLMRTSAGVRLCMSACVCLYACTMQCTCTYLDMYALLCSYIIMVNACTHAHTHAGGVYGLDRINVLCGSVVARELLSDVSPSVLLQVVVHDSIILLLDYFFFIIRLLSKSLLLK
jgi:hypothetical protein